MSSPASIVALAAPAKLNWSLEVTGTRSDGFHELRSEMVSLSLHDDIELDEGASGFEQVMTGDPRCDVVLDGRDNLIVRALDFVGRRARVRVTKRIPVGGGLGGGSSDAAAILRWAQIDDPTRAVTLGSDVPFCIRGGRSIVEGVGEILRPLEPVAREVVLVIPDFAVDTRACYLAFDELVTRGDRPSGRNHLTAAARAVEPRLGQLMDWLGALTGREVTLCGSGSTLFLEGSVSILDDATSLVTPVGEVRVIGAVTTGPL